MGVGEFGGEGDFFVVVVQWCVVYGCDNGDIVGQVEGGFEGFCQLVLQV